MIGGTRNLIPCDDFKRPLTAKEMKKYRKNIHASKQESDEEGKESHFVSF